MNTLVQLRPKEDTFFVAFFNICHSFITDIFEFFITYFKLGL